MKTFCNLAVLVLAVLSMTSWRAVAQIAQPEPSAFLLRTEDLPRGFNGGEPTASTRQEYLVSSRSMFTKSRDGRTEAVIVSVAAAPWDGSSSLPSDAFERFREPLMSSSSSPITGIAIGDQSQWFSGVISGSPVTWALFRVGAVMGAVGVAVTIGPVNQDDVVRLAQIHAERIRLVMRGANALPAAATAFPEFAGYWGAHGFGLDVSDAGAATASWRVYQWCDPGVSEPCDNLIDNQIINGGRAEMSLDTIGGNSASGIVTSTTDPRTFPLGPMSVTLIPYNRVILNRWGQESVHLCGPIFGLLTPEDLLFDCGV